MMVREFRYQVELSLSPILSCINLAQNIAFGHAMVVSGVQVMVKVGISQMGVSPIGCMLMVPLLLVTSLIAFSMEKCLLLTGVKTDSSQRRWDMTLSVFDSKTKLVVTRMSCLVLLFSI